MSLIKCPECGNEISTNAKSCPKCGCEVTICPDCGAVYAGKTEICKNCGYKFKTAEQNSDKDDNVLIKAKQFTKAVNALTLAECIINTIGDIFLIAGVFILLNWQRSDPLEQLENYKSVITQTRNFAVIFITLYSICSSLKPLLFAAPFMILHISFSRFLNESNTDCLLYCKQNINVLKDKKNIKAYRFITTSAYYQKNPKAQKLSYFIGIIACIFYLLAIIFLANFIFNGIDTFEYNVFYGLEIKLNSFNYTPLVLFIVSLLIATIICGALNIITIKKTKRLLMANSLPVNIV